MSGKANRKHGGTKRKPSQQRYVAERRSEKNKARKLAKANRWRELCGKVRAIFERKAKDGEKLKDTQRRIRKMLAAA